MREWRQRSGGGNARDLLRAGAEHIMQDFVSKAARLNMTSSVPRAPGRAKQKSAMTNMGECRQAETFTHIHGGGVERQTFRICFGGRTEGIYNRLILEYKKNKIKTKPSLELS